MTVTTDRSAFVAGATGYTGQALVHELRQRGIPTVAHVRSDSQRLAEWRQRLEAVGAVVNTTPWDEGALTAALQRSEPHAIFALLGTTRSRMRAAGGADSYESVDYGLTAMLLHATRRGLSRARFVYLSSAGVGPAARGEYLRVRWRLEQELRASGLAWTIVRPAFITGADRSESRPLERFGARIIDGLLGVAGALGARRLRDRYASLSAAALARGLADHAFAPDSEGLVLGADALRRRVPR